MRIIGLTGRSGSGKSTVCEAAKKRNIPVMDCDRVYAEMTSHPSPFLDAICETFGEGCVRDDALYRPVMREIVFGNEDARRKLNALTAHYMGEEIRLTAASLAGKSNLLLLDAPTLFDTGLDSLCDCTVCVIAPEQDCLARIMARDGISKQDARKRLNSQLPDAFFASHCDYVIRNDGDLPELLETAEAFFLGLLYPEQKK